MKAINVYSFSELNETVKQKVLTDLLYINVELPEWWDAIYNDAENIGLKITAFDIDRNRHAEGHFTISACEVAQNILNNHGDMCETYKTADNFLKEWQPVFNDYMNENSENYESGELEDKLNDIEDDFLKSLLEDYSIILQNEYEYLTSDEAIIETIEANEYEFTKEGIQI